VYLAANRKDKAAMVFADLGDFKQAAELAEAAGQLDKAGEYFTKAGDAENAARVKALPRPEPKPAAQRAAEAAEAAAEEAAGSTGEVAEVAALVPPEAVAPPTPIAEA
jgi:hypothetical protein